MLCHISSLPNKYGIGSMGKEAYRFADFLYKAKVKYWQVLPIVQTGYGDSPYQSVCCNSGNPYFIDLEQLNSQGLLTPEELKEQEEEYGKIDYASLYKKRYLVLRKAYSRFNLNDARFLEFVNGGEFEDYALFMSLKTVYGGSFRELPNEYKYRCAASLEKFKNENYAEYCFWQFLQYEFFTQWSNLKNYVNVKGIKIIGDIPLYVASDSSDVWSRSELFDLDEDLNPVSVAGVPPDYFSKTGQLWGNPLYNWKAMEAENYDWWITRIKSAKKIYDVMRIDHFRGLDRYYAIDAGEKTAVNGEWREGPKIALFNAIEKELGKVEFIAEDLGVLDEGVINLREKTGFPGMKILLFAFDGNEDNEYLPENTQRNSVTYTGTHDNDTALGYLNTLTEEEFCLFKKRLRASLKSQNVFFPVISRQDCAYGLVLCALANKSDLTVIPVQDLFCLNNDARMNTPSVAHGNWKFRLKQIPTRYDSAVLRKYIKKFNR